MAIKLNDRFLGGFLSENEIEFMQPFANNAYELLTSGKGPGNDFLGWVNYPNTFDQEEFARIKKAAEKIRKDSEVLVVIGIGGSYLGAKAIIEALSPYFKKEKDLEVIFAGHNLSSTYAMLS